MPTVLNYIKLELQRLQDKTSQFQCNNVNYKKVANRIKKRDETNYIRHDESKN